MHMPTPHHDFAILRACWYAVCRWLRRWLMWSVSSISRKGQWLLTRFWLRLSHSCSTPLLLQYDLNSRVTILLIFFFWSCKPSHYYYASTQSTALYFETILETICKQWRYIIRYFFFLGIHGVSCDCVYICLQVIIIVGSNSAPVLVSHILGIFLQVHYTLLSDCIFSAVKAALPAWVEISSLASNFLEYIGGVAGAEWISEWAGKLANVRIAFPPTGYKLYCSGAVENGE